MVIGNLVLGAAHAAVGRGLRARRAGHRRSPRTPALLDGRRISGVVRDLPDRADHPGLLVPPDVARRRRGRAASRCSSTCATGSSNQATDARAARRLVRRGGAALGGRLVVRRRLHGGLALAGRPVAAGGGRRRLRQGRAGRLPLAAALRRVRRPARRAAGRTRFLPAANDYLLRQDWSEGFATAVHVASTWTPAPSSSAPPATRPPYSCCAGIRTLGRPRGRGTGARADDATPEFTVVRGRPRAAATRCCCSPTAWWRRPQRDISLGIDKLLGQGEQLLRERLRGRRRNG